MVIDELAVTPVLRGMIPAERLEHLDNDSLGLTVYAIEQPVSLMDK